jgi:anti-sigma regulatory factor (Ser/Thr protein kinase)
MADPWPLRSSLVLGALLGAVPCARLHARSVLWEWGLTELSDVVELLVSELVTNALRASQAMEQESPIRLWVLSDKSQVLITVWDGNLRPPVRIDVDEDTEGGRGLLLVETLSEQWGWYPAKDIGGKWVWCTVTANQPS